MTLSAPQKINWIAGLHSECTGNNHLIEFTAESLWKQKVVKKYSKLPMERKELKNSMWLVGEE